MFPYWVLFTIFATGAVGSRQQGPGVDTQRQPLLLLAVILMTGFIGLRFGLGPDWPTYLIIYKETSRLDFWDAISHQDPGFYTLMWLGHRLGLEIWAVNLTCAAIFTSGLLAFSKRQPNPWLAITAAIPYLVIVVAMSGVRQATAIGFIFLALSAFSRKKLSQLIFWVMCASTFHATALLMVVLVGLSYTRNRFQALVLLCIAAIPSYYILVSSWEVYYNRYIMENLQSEGTIYRVLMNFVPAAYLLLNLRKFPIERDERTLWRNFALVGIVCLPLIFFVPSSTALDRVSLYIIPLQIYVISRIPIIFSKNPDKSRFMTLVLIILLCVILLIFFTFSTHGKYYIPYRLYQF